MAVARVRQVWFHAPSVCFNAAVSRSAVRYPDWQASGLVAGVGVNLFTHRHWLVDGVGLDRLGAGGPAKAGLDDQVCYTRAGYTRRADPRAVSQRSRAIRYQRPERRCRVLLCHRQLFVMDRLDCSSFLGKNLVRMFMFPIRTARRNSGSNLTSSLLPRSV